jgi:hypothetical protein
VAGRGSIVLVLERASWRGVGAGIDRISPRRRRRLSDDPAGSVLRLRCSSAGCDWLIGRWRLLGNGLSTAAEGRPGCTWTDADLALALNLLCLPPDLRHLDDRAGRLQSLRDDARSGSDEAATELREIVTEEIAELEEANGATPPKAGFPPAARRRYLP